VPEAINRFDPSRSDFFSDRDSGDPKDLGSFFDFVG
jgi:hypothetical protein